MLEKSSRVKVIRTRQVVEIYQYENMPGNAPRKPKEADSSEWKKYRAKNGKQKRDYVRRLITQNFDSGDKFITLTFGSESVEDVRSVSECFEAFRAFRERLRRRYGGVKAVTVVEFQDKSGRGAVHYHMICNLPYLKKRELQELWANGFVKINKIDSVDNVGAYVVKYMGKSLDDVRLRYHKAYYRMGKLEEPQVTWFDDTEALAGLVDGRQPIFESYYGDEFHGRILYHQYNLNRTSVLSGDLSEVVEDVTE